MGGEEGIPPNVPGCILPPAALTGVISDALASFLRLSCRITSNKVLLTLSLSDVYSQGDS